MSNRLRTVAICIVLTVWTVNMLTPVFFAALAPGRSFTPDPSVNLAFLAISGFLAAGYKKNGNEGGRHG